MEIEKIKQSKNIIGEEVSNSFKEIGTENMKILCRILGELKILIERLSEAE